MLKLEIPNTIFQQMVARAKALAPIEDCGILAGINGRVEKFYKMTNTDNSSTHYMMDPKEQFATVKDIRSAGLEMLAIYHSHPETPARPSAVDIKLALTPNVIYVIVSLQNNNGSVVKGFHIAGTNVTEVPIKIMER
ncbi:MAG: M67 family metallopeptidase [Sedimentisphaerales bacterium]|nr:M67 family metallopeptidase [Sedimentisphaerales bacterium]